MDNLEITKVDPSKISRSVRITKDDFLVYGRRARLKPSNWDELATEQIAKGYGFRITEPGKSDVNETAGYYSIHSPLYGSDYNNESGFLGIWQCRCGRINGRAYADGRTICSNCNEPVTFYPIDMRKTGWIIMDRDMIMTGGMFKRIQAYIGVDRLDQILDYETPNKRVSVVGNPYVGIGMVEFRERFSEIMNFYLSRATTKIAQYNFIMANQNKIWSHAIPVYSMHLRYFLVESSQIKYSKADIIFKRIFTNVTILNDRFEMQRRKEQRALRDRARAIRGDDTRRNTEERMRRENILYDIQKEVEKLWELSFSEVDTSSKTGLYRIVSAGGRINYVARCVIVKNVTLKQDEIGLGYVCFLELYKNEIMQKLSKLYGYDAKQASMLWAEAKVEFNATVYDVMIRMITEETQYADIWRNPTINFGSWMTMKIVNINTDINDYCLELPVLVLAKPNADMDGDIMNVRAHVDLISGQKAYECQNPLDNMMISHNDGLFDKDMNVKKDLEMDLNAFFTV